MPAPGLSHIAGAGAMDPSLGPRLDAAAAALCAARSPALRAGILASDESTPTLGRRLTAAGLPNDAPTRAAWRECMYGAELGVNGISGAIVFEEALEQKTHGGQPLLRLLTDQGVAVGVKADQGLAPLDGGAEGETRTKGLPRLARGAAKEWAAAGASFAKWRAALRVPPSPEAVRVNVEELARYAAACQAAGLVPVVEPELLIDGAHDAETAASALRTLLKALFAALKAHGVRTSGVLLKIMPAVPGADADPTTPRPSDAALATLTIDSLAATVPADVPGVMLLSGGLGEEGATRVLNACAAEAASRSCPWAVSYSFGRALQASCMAAWAAGRREGEEAEAAALPAARAALEAAASANSAAAAGAFAGEHPAANGEARDLREGFRGFRDDAASKE